MKKRNGFVSNSSSSSFVLLGAEIKDFNPSTEEKAEILNKFAIECNYEDRDDVDEAYWDCFNDGSFGLDNPSETDVYGDKLAASENDYMEEYSFSFAKLILDADKIRENIKKLTGKDVEIKLITGTCSC